MRLGIWGLDLSACYPSNKSPDSLGKAGIVLVIKLVKANSTNVPSNTHRPRVWTQKKAEVVPLLRECGWDLKRSKKNTQTSSRLAYVYQRSPGTADQETDSLHGNTHQGLHCIYTHSGRKGLAGRMGSCRCRAQGNHRRRPPQVCILCPWSSAGPNKEQKRISGALGDEFCKV